MVDPPFDNKLARHNSKQEQPHNLKNHNKSLRVQGRYSKLDGNPMGHYNPGWRYRQCRYKY